MIFAGLGGQQLISAVTALATGALVRREVFPVSGIAVLLASLLLCHPTASRAQDSPVPGADTRMEEIIVTGTRIPRRDFFSPSPISTVDREFLEYSGQPTLEEALNQMPQISPDYGRTSNNPGDGTSRINLRGLGAERTLVMLNGRRLAPSGAGSAVDVNNLPQALINRVEIITGGASAVYGSDAIAGVVNIITETAYDGFSVEASYYSTEQGDSEVGDLNLVFGHNLASGRGNITVYGNYLERQESFAADRDISAVALQENLRGELEPGGSASIPGGLLFFPELDFGNGPQQGRFDESGNVVPFTRPDDLYDFAPVNYLQIPLTRYSAGLFANYRVSERVEFYTELAFTRNESLQNLVPIPAGGFYVTNLDNPVLSDQLREVAASEFVPVAPGLVGFGMRRRWEELGPRIGDNRRDYTRVVAGLRGSLSERWDYDVWVTYTDSDESTMLLNAGSASRIDQGLLVNPATGECFDPGNGCVPVDVFGPGRVSLEAADFVRVAEVENTTQREQTLVSAFLTGSPLNLPAGPLDVAVGVEWRQDEIAFRADEGLFTGSVKGAIAIEVEYKLNRTIQSQHKGFSRGRHLNFTRYRLEGHGLLIDIRRIQYQQTLDRGE